MRMYTRKAVFAELKKYDILSGDHDFIEIVMWNNGDGFDVDISSNPPQRFQLTWGMFAALKKMVKALDKFDK